MRFSFAYLFDRTRACPETEHTDPGFPETLTEQLIIKRRQFERGLALQCQYIQCTLLFLRQPA